MNISKKNDHRFWKRWRAAGAMKGIEGFFAVTLTSVYEVRSDFGDGRPSAMKIALKGRSFIKIGECFQDGTMIAICKWIQIYFPEKYDFTPPPTGVERKIERVNIRYWGESTSDIVALFRNKEEALACLKEIGLKACDSRWIRQTKVVLDLIGENHPAFEICHFNGLALACAVGE